MATMFLNTFLLFHILFYAFCSANDASSNVAIERNDSVKASSNDSALSKPSVLELLTGEKVVDIEQLYKKRDRHSDNDNELLELLQQGDCVEFLSAVFPKGTSDPNDVLNQLKRAKRLKGRFLKSQEKQSEAQLLKKSLSVLSKYLKAHSQQSPHSLNKQQENNFKTVRDGIHQLYNTIEASSQQSEPNPNGELQENLLTSLQGQLTQDAFKNFTAEPNLTSIIKQSLSQLYGSGGANSSNDLSLWNIEQKPDLKSVLELVSKLYENHKENSRQNDRLPDQERRFLALALTRLKLYLNSYTRKYYYLLTRRERANLSKLRKEVASVNVRFKRLPEHPHELNAAPVILPFAIVSPVLLPIYLGQQVTEEPKVVTTEAALTTETTEESLSLPEVPDFSTEAPSLPESTTEDAALTTVTNLFDVLTEEPPKVTETPIEIIEVTTEKPIEIIEVSTEKPPELLLFPTEGASEPTIVIDANGNNQATGGGGGGGGGGQFGGNIIQSGGFEFPVYQERPLPLSVLQQLTLLGYGQLYEKYFYTKPLLLSSSSHHSIRYPAFLNEE
ncbi:PREDICTED: uncharacterized protein LOC108612089 isoform X3 [Drosophila arizonae]|uniref:Uncharacterized protein LOC108612089 isoform X2 n=1 Tax=Drosophila arizonae TaxID=7263 RepID=A0ABM1NZU3_DROAR|nr:PREDICTED: uncharacterized protein LOC108612089 isoform X2 [Drosophila arizonae]XP_017860479.1 PREDICTED: uncharacterized protein LOC108612089 isoform X3 [Drosophila arizonae]